jgi:hypothetical protein
MPEKAFVSMPYGVDPESPQNEWSMLFDYGLKPLERKMRGKPDFEPIRLLRADRELRDLNLKNHVKELIQDSALIIGVLTTTPFQTRKGKELRISNPNVLWELGYAEAHGKPIVVLADHSSIKDLPVLAGTPSVCNYNHKLVQAATQKDATKTLAHIAHELAPYVILGLGLARSGNARQNGRGARVYSGRERIGLGEVISTANKNVNILTTNVGWFLHNMGPGINQTAHPFARALLNGVPVQIVTMDPESVIAEYRARQLLKQDDVPGYRRELREGIVELFQRFGHLENFHLHIYNDLPLQITVWVDHRIITSIVTTGERARTRLHVEFSEFDEGVTESFTGHFQSMFNNSKDVRGVAWVLRPHMETWHEADQTQPIAPPERQ